MFDGFGRLTLFIESDGQDRVTVCVIRLDQQGGPRMLDRSFKPPFLKASMAKTVTGRKVIGTYGNRFLVVNDRVVDSSLLKKSIGQGYLSIWIVWLHPDGLVEIENRLVHVAFAQKSGAEIVIGIPKIGLHLQRRPIMRNRIVKLAFLKQDDAQIVVSDIAAGRHVSVARSATTQSAALKIKVRLFLDVSAKLTRPADARAIGPIQAKY